MSAVKDEGPPGIEMVTVAVSKKETPTVSAVDDGDGGPPGIPKVTAAVSEKGTFVSDEASSDRSVQK